MTRAVKLQSGRPPTRHENRRARSGSDCRVQLRLPGRPGVSILCGLIVILSVSAGLRSPAPNAWQPDEVPVAFWSWLSRTPEDDDVRRANLETGSRALFLRSGQIDLENGRLRLIRAVKGRFPKTPELHVVYNGTPSFLRRFETTTPEMIASAISEGYGADAIRSLRDGVDIRGVQLDFDVPTRLLGRYAAVLRKVRDRLPDPVVLSITGLPTWMNDARLPEVLDSVAFWIPQLYGAAIPDRVDRIIPIASPDFVRKTIDRARQLNRPYLAGLAAYGYTIHYSSEGSLIAVIGDLNPDLVAGSPDLELVEGAPFNTGNRPPQGAITTSASNWRYLFRARSETVIEGLAIRGGDLIMLDVPSEACLGEMARIVRERGGKKLLGICIFRLPTSGRRTTLGISEIGSALRGEEGRFSVALRATSTEREAEGDRPESHVLSLTITNDGAASTRLGPGAFSVHVLLPAGRIRRVSVDGFDSIETQCAPTTRPRNPEERLVLYQCGPHRANVLQLTSGIFMPGQDARCSAELDKDPGFITFEISARLADGREWRHRASAPVERERGRELDE